MDISAYDLSVLAGKTVVVVVVLLGLYRVLGKRNLAQFSTYDLVTVMAVANSVQNAMTAGKGSVLVGIVCASTLLALAYGMTKLFTRVPSSERLVLGEPVVLVNNGVLLRDRLRRERITIDELQAALRDHGLVRPEQASMVILEVDGSISVVPKPAHTRHGNQDVI